MPRILIVDDHAVTREPLVRLLRYEGFDAVAAANGVEALAALNAGPVGLMVMDLMMPKMDGLKLLEAVRRDPRWRDLPVLVMTALVEGSSLDRARELNVRGIIIKAQFDLADLFDRIRDCLKGDGGAGGGGGDGPTTRRCCTDQPVAA